MSNPENPHDKNDFLTESQADRTGLVAEFIDFLKHNKKWWLVPILVAVAGIIALVAVALSAGGAAMPFIYPLF